MADSFEGKVALITGGSQGIGRAVAGALARKGMNLILAARSADKLELAAIELRQSGVRVLTVPTDVSKRADLERLVAASVAEFGRIDVLINNAGIEAFRVFHEIPLDQIEATVKTNTIGSLLLTRLVIPVMLERGWGRIINMSSTAAYQAPPFGATYAATKASLLQFSMALRLEYAGTGISSSAICPGFTNDGGIYEQIKTTMGRGMPWLLRGTTAEAVAKKVIKALRTDPPIIVVDKPGVRLMIAIFHIFPRFGEWVTHKVATRFFRKLANKREHD